VAHLLNLLCLARLGQRRYADGESLARQALAIWERAFGKGAVQTRISVLYLGRAARLQGRRVEAERLMREAIALFERRLGMEHRDLITAHQDLADLLQGQWRCREAIVEFERAVAIAESRLAPGHPITARLLARLGETLNVQGDIPAAQEKLARALAAMEARPAATQPGDLVRCLNGLAMVHVRTGRDALAAPLLERALAVLEGRKGLRPDEWQMVLSNLGNLHHRQQRPERALPLLERSVRVSEAAAADSYSAGKALYWLAEFHRQHGQLVDAERAYLRERPILERALGPAHVESCQVLRGLGLVRQAQGLLDQAQELLDTVVARTTAAVGEGHVEVLEAERVRAQLLALRKEDARARPLAERVLALTPRTDGWLVAAAWHVLGDVHAAAGRSKDAAAAFDTAIDHATRTLGAAHSYVARLRGLRAAAL
jgi:tetratricopeptide (TPR) repeat protein